MKRTHGAKPAAPLPQQPPSSSWLMPAGALAAAVIAAIVFYTPALSGPFLFDDRFAMFGRPDAAQLPLAAWLPARPITGLTHYLNYLLSGTSTLSYHLFNLAAHIVTSALAFLVLWLALEGRETLGRAKLIAGLGACVFLLHPLQTEAVAYISGRSDVMCALFAYAALAVFLRYRRPAIGISSVAAVLLLSLLALLSKQQAVAIPAVFILVDLLWREDGESPVVSLKRNIRLHSLLAAGAVAGAAWVFAELARADTAGLHIEGVTPRQYFSTQCRAVWYYLRLLVLPLGQNADPDFPLSPSLADPAAAIGLVLLLALIGAAFYLRKSWPLAAAGILIFLAFLAPTSSFIPIKDPVAERRVYFPMIGALLVLADALRRWRVPNPTLGAVGAGVLLGLGILTHGRAVLWGNELALWQDTVAASPQKLRPRFQLAYQYYAGGKCQDAVREYAAAARLGPPTVELLVDWGLALECAGQSEAGLAKVREALTKERTFAAVAQLGMMLAKRREFVEALPLMDEAVTLDPNHPSAYAYRGNLHASEGRLTEAEADFRRALTLAPNDEMSQRGLNYIQQRRQSGNPARQQ